MNRRALIQSMLAINNVDVPSRYVQTTSADFDTSGNYIGTEAYIILPSNKKGGYNITNTNVIGVATNGNYLTSTQNMFNGNNSLYLELDYLDTSKVTNMGNMFFRSQATTLDLSNFDTSNVTDMRYMFDGSQATTLNLSSFDTSSVTDMDGMFTDSQATSGYAATQADADNFNSSSNKPSTLTFVAKFPSRYVRTTTLDFDSNGNYIGTEAYIILPSNKKGGYNITNTNVIGVATNGNYLTDASNMFNDNNSLYLELDYLDTSKVTNMGNMFFRSQATTLDLSNFDTSNVTIMYGMFFGSQATALDLSNFDTSNVTNMGNMFEGSQATTLDLSNFDTSNVTDMRYMFDGSQATTLDLSSFDTSKVTNMRDMFDGSRATSGYAKTQTDADNFNGSSNKPSTLTFVVKQKGE